MSYIIYNKETTRILSARARSAGCYVENYKSEAAAKAALTRLDKKNKLGDRVVEMPNKKNNFTRKTESYVKEDFAIAEARDFFDNIEKKVTRKNIMSGKEFEEGVNTPGYLSPASEAYWSM